MVRPIALFTPHNGLLGIQIKTNVKPTLTELARSYYYYECYYGHAALVLMIC